MKPQSRILLIITTGMLLLATLACTISLPDVQVIKTGESQTMEISQPKPSGDGAVLEIKMAAGELDIQGGSDQWVDGTVEYNVPDWDPTITAEGNHLTIDQAEKITNTIPTHEVENRWDLRLGDVPMELHIDAGAYNGTVDLSGVPVTRLEISDGASKGRLIFNSPNPVEMDELIYHTGASDVRFMGLANANFERMTLTIGAGNYTIDFSGELQRDARVRISGGVSNTRIVIPEGMHAIIDVSGGLNNVDTDGTWTSHGDTYETAGSGPTLQIDVDVAAGNLELEHER